MRISRRRLLTGLGAACCTAASPFVTPVVFAAAPGENRL
ncbi:MAG: twin-arginine translocation signal domain-containing protein, partial [Hyphomicrobiales bacterium]|nr:twin-arginine translocation signal domain-containing protein [Hyphomicrobiales bacterium]